jgi:hypothetical protein
MSSLFLRYPGRYTHLLGLFLAVSFLFNSALLGQNSTGSLSGIVTDSTGAVIPQANVVLTNEATNVTRETVSNNSGFFSFVAVQPATVPTDTGQISQTLSEASDLKNQGIAKPDDSYYYPGGDIGGPVILPKVASIGITTSSSFMPIMKTCGRTRKVAFSAALSQRGK